MPRKKWLPPAIGVLAALMVIVPFVLVNKPKNPHQEPGGMPAQSAQADLAPPLPTEIAPDAAEKSDPEKEMAMLTQHLVNAPAHTPVLLRLAELARGSGKVSDAVKYLRQAVAAEPRNEDARLELGRALFEAGDVEGAIRETKALLEINPRNVDGLYNLGAIYGNRGDFVEARRNWEAAIKASPNTESAAKSRTALAQIR